MLHRLFQKNFATTPKRRRYRNFAFTSFACIWLIRACTFSVWTRPWNKHRKNNIWTSLVRVTIYPCNISLCNVDATASALAVHGLYIIFTTTDCNFDYSAVNKIRSGNKTIETTTNGVPFVAGKAYHSFFLFFRFLSYFLRRCIVAYSRVHANTCKSCHT